MTTAIAAQPAVIGPWSQTDIEEDLAVHASLRRGDGCLSDGQERAYDHYTGWALHPHSLLWTRLFDVTGSLCPPQLRATWEADLARYLDDAVRLLGTDGSPLLQGRSLIYRFAAAAPLWTGAISGASLSDADDVSKERVGEGADDTLVQKRNGSSCPTVRLSDCPTVRRIR